MKKNNLTYIKYSTFFLILFLIPVSFALGIQRNLPLEVTPNTDITVYLNVNATTQFSLQENVPENWTIISASTNPRCDFSTETRIIRCFLEIRDGVQNRVLNYTVKSPNTRGVYTFSGVSSVDGSAETTTSGNNQITVTSTLPTPTNVPPTAPVLSAPQTGTANTQYTFTATSTDPENNQIKYDWDWNGDGIIDYTSNLANSGTSDTRQYSYPSIGTYTIKVRAVDSIGAFSNYTQQTITISSQPTPLAISISGPNSAYTNTQVQFNSTVSGGTPPYTYSWNFGDGKTSAQSNGINNYSSSGTYTARLTVTDSASQTFSQQVTITIAPPPSSPLAVSIAAPTSAQVNSQVQFNSTTSGGTPPYKYNWEFGDQKTSNQTNPTNTYSSAGTYTARLTVTDSASQPQSISQIHQITIISSTPLSINLGGPYSGAKNTQIQFNPTVVGGTPPYRYNWNFGDSAISTQQTPSHAYVSEGTYTIILNVTDNLSNSISSTTLVSITASIADNESITGDVTRILASSVASGSTITVLLNIDVGNATYYAIEEYPPQGWIITGIDKKLGCDYSTTTNIVSCVVIQNAVSGIVVYNVSVPSNLTIGSLYNFSGVYGIGSKKLRNIGGNNLTTIGNIADFNISANTLSASLSPGSSTNIQLTITSINGYNSPISLGSNTINDVSITFNPMSGSQSFISNININVGATATQGTYTINLKATGGDGKTKEIPFTLTINPTVSADFSISLNQSTILIGQGNSSSIKANITAIGGYNFPTTFSASAPNGILISFNPQSSTPTFITTASITVNNNTTPGTYTINIRANGTDGKSKETPLYLTVVESQNQTNLTNTTKANLTIDTYPVKGDILLSGSTIGQGPKTIHLDPGIYYISFSNITGYYTPASRTINLTAGQNLTINESYTQSSYCGDGYCNAAETCSSCSKDCGACPCIQKIDSIDSDNLVLSTNCLTANLTSVWPINNASIFTITGVNVTSRKTLNKSKITINKIQGSGLQEAYQYFNITSDINDSDIVEVTIGFAVRSSWISSNNIRPDSVAINRYIFSWIKLTTIKLNNDSTFTYYKSTTSGFSLYGINGEKASCPICNPPTEWSLCANGKQTRTNYICDQTIVSCQAVEENLPCCPQCPLSTDWSTCNNGKQTKKTYECGAHTSYQCLEKEEQQSCTSSQDALTAIESAVTAINAADKENKNTTKAKELLSKAQAAFAANDYENSRNIANEAKLSAQNAPKIASTFFLPLPFEYLMMIILAAAVGGAGFMVWKRKMHAPICTVCARPTAMKFICNTCNGHVCFKDSKIYQGKIYCNNCIRKLSMQQKPPR